MNDKAVLIQAISAIPCFDQLPLSVPLSCEINAASLVCLLGEHFSFTNAYMQMVAGTNEPYAGSISYLDSLLNSSVQNQCPQIAYLYNNSALLSVLNGIDNVKAPALYHQLESTKQIDKEVDALLGELEYGANHRLLPAYMDTFQRRHLLIVRAIILKPKILCIENPFSGLDREQAWIFGEYLASLVKNKNITVIISNGDNGIVK